MLTLELSSYVLEMCIYNIQSKSDWLIHTQSRVLQGDWLVLANNETMTLNIIIPYHINMQGFYFRKRFLDFLVHVTIWIQQSIDASKRR